jgi:tartrate dehydrogenase/decarboxylase/D-malate dehydrogenase
MQYTAVMWDEVAEEVARDYPDVQVRKLHVDAAAYQMVLHPDWFDVMVGSNLFADILTDLGAALQGSLGLAASANLDPTRAAPSMFEPVHGSAPDIAGKGIANPMAAIWTASMMLEHLGEPDAAGAVFDALRRVVRGAEVRTPDLGGRGTTTQVGDAVVEALRARRTCSSRTTSRRGSSSSASCARRSSSGASNPASGSASASWSAAWA